MLKNIFFLFLLVLSTWLSAQDFSYALLPGDTAIIMQRDYCGDSIHWQQLIGTNWIDIEGENGDNLQLINEGQEIEVKQFRAVIRFANDPEPKLGQITSIRFATSFDDLIVSDFYDGAHLYYVSSDTLLSALVTDHYAPWGCYGQIINGADHIGLGTGAQNTLDIINDCLNNSIAAFICDTITKGHHDDWYLPSTDEANTISAELSFNNIADFGFNDYIWTSTEAWSTLNTITAQNAVRKLLPYQGFTYNYADKRDTARIIASRMIVAPEPFHVSINAYLEENALTGTIDVNPVAESRSKFEVEYTGNIVADAAFHWDFRDGLLLEGGTGPGPHIVSYTFGGYRQISATITSNLCTSSTYKSLPFQPLVVEDIEAPFPVIYNGMVDFVDYNNDKLLDAFLVGNDTSCLYRNTDQYQFEFINASFPSLRNAHCSWGDYDNDGWTDLLICGWSAQSMLPQTYLLRNEAGIQFSEIETSLPSISDGFIEWLDYNNDGALDVLLSGKDSDGNPLTQLYRGDKSGSFEEVVTPFSALINSGIALDDYNKDNFVDVLLFGKNGNERHCILYQNEGGTFIAQALDLVGIDNGAATWADFNDDGQLDFYITGNQEDVVVEMPSSNQLWVSLQSSVYGEIYLQTEDGTFSTFDNPYLPNKGFDYAFNSLETGDFDNDGRTDILTTGMPWVAWLTTGIGGGPQDFDNWPHRSKPSIFRNRGDGFTNLELNIPAIYTEGIIPEPAHHYASDAAYNHSIMSTFETSSATFGDFNNDGNLDIFREGRGMSKRSAIYQHEACVSNVAPSVPNNLSTIAIDCDTIRLNWNIAVDDHTPATNMTYELYVGSSPGQDDVISRKNIRKLRNSFFVLSGLADGTYYWSVKAVDDAQKSSQYATEATFEIDCLVNTSEAINQPEAFVFPNPFQSSFQILLEEFSSIPAYFEVINPLGQVVKKGNFLHQTIVTLNDNTEGIYFIKLNVGSK
ncbi:MAG: FG-GAP-like repeat-containing protein [Bacteroidota bacterium]